LSLSIVNVRLLFLSPFIVKVRVAGWWVAGWWSFFVSFYC
jgi:hypothetical protein